MKAGTPLTYASLKLGPTRFVVEVLVTGIANAALSFNVMASGGTWKYQEVEKAELFESPRWAGIKGDPRDRFPVGIRIHFGESRSALLFFTSDVEALLAALKSHRVAVERTPIKLSRFLFGRR